MTDEGKLKCQFCNYMGHKPMLRLHLYMQHGIDLEDEQQKSERS
jgi:hypothetical protein